MNGVMKVSDLEKVQKQMKIIQGDVFMEFAAQVIHWYQQDLLKTHIVRNNEIPPNLFQLFEHPGLDDRPLISLFKGQRDNPEAQQDVAAVLNAYRMFYIYQDDAHPFVRYYNHFGGDVW